MGITLSPPLPQSAATRPSIWACSRSTLVLPLGFLKLNPVIVGPLLPMPRVPVKECNDPFFGRGELAGKFVDFDKRSAVFFGDELSPFFRRGKDPYVVFSALLVRDPC